MKIDLPREIALRIGLAARALPGVSVGTFLNGLVGQLGWPLTEEKLSRVTVSQLKKALAGDGGVFEEGGDATTLENIIERFGLTRLKEVVEILWGRTAEEENLPHVEAYADGDMPRSIRVAVASDSDEDLNAHFGSCRRFLVYQINAGECRLVSLRSTTGADEAEDSSAFRAELIRDCHVLFVQSIGGPAAAKVINAGIYPLKYAEAKPAREYLDELRKKMASLPPPWLAKAMNIPVEDRIRFHVEAV
jgi:nitrogen fixation protein NifX